MNIKKVDFGLNRAEFDPFGLDLGKFGPNDKFRSRLIQSAYYALTFSEEIRKKYQAVFD